MQGRRISSAYRFTLQPGGDRPCYPLIAIELQRRAGCVIPFCMTKIDLDVIADIAAKRKIDGKARAEARAD
jgi:hypothetical protein